MFYAQKMVIIILYCVFLTSGVNLVLLECSHFHAWRLKHGLISKLSFEASVRYQIEIFKKSVRYNNYSGGT